MSEVLLQTIEKCAVSTEGKTTQLRKGQTMVEIGQEHLKDFISRLVNEASVHHLSTITGLDLNENIEIIYHFSRDNVTIHVKTLVPKTQPTAISIVDMIPGAILYEMEIHDMLGVTFIGNPRMDKKLLLPDNWPADLPPPLLKTAKLPEMRKRLGLEASQR
jgi:NADH:ubiquinone oxidoreductase subunit C